MSGFVAILDGDGRPIDAELLHEITASMSLQGPDAQETWRDGPIGFGHALLRTTRESERERQPHNSDGEVWITGDIRLDRRDELSGGLIARGCRCERDTPDVELVARAYRLWGEACVDRLSGDFAFALWDRRSQCLFCARDQFGVAPFYYAQTKNTLILSNHIDCIRAHPRISDRLDERALGDFLLFNYNQDPATTTFADIQRLPPAHTLVWSHGKVRIRRYWQLPETVTEQLRYRPAEEYIERFQELFERAIADRLRTGRVGIYFSGGMDSSSIAAIAYRLLTATGSAVDFRAYTIVYKELIFDDEGDHAAQVATKVGFPIEYFVAEDYLRQVPEEHPEYTYPEPLGITDQMVEGAIMRHAAGYGRVLLAGFGGDPALALPWCYWIELLRHKRSSQLVRGTLEYIRAFHRPPGFGLRTQARVWLRRRRNTVAVPDWINPDYAQRVDLETRWREIVPRDCWTARSHRGMATDPLWPQIFATSDPGFTGIPVKVRFPFFDVRLVSYLQSIPPIPWLERKFLLREAMQGSLPEAVRLRPKTILRGHPQHNLMQQQGVQPWMESLLAVPQVAPYIDGKRLLQSLRAVEKPGPIRYLQTYPALVLAYWLRSRTSGLRCT